MNQTFTKHGKNDALNTKKTHEIIEWVYYYKAIAIILVVIGHSTGRYNQYIYQFHIGAFFLISGFLSNTSKKRLDEILITKFFGLLLPYLFYAVTGLLLFDVLQRFELLQYVSVHTNIPSFFQNLGTVFTALYCDWLGASWFLVSLFGVSIISKVINIFDQEKTGIIYILVSLGMFVYGYKLRQSGVVYPIFGDSLPHYMIIQFYFVAGWVVRVYLTDVINKINTFICVCLVIICCLNFHIINMRWQIVMDLVSTSVNQPLKDFTMVLNGTLFIIACSKLIEAIRRSRLKRVLKAIGNNTLGILLFHFLGFKITTLALYLLKICKIEHFSGLVPPSDVSFNWWPVYTVVSIIFSLLVWKGIKSVSVLNFLSGQNKQKYNQIYKRYIDNLR